MKSFFKILPALMFILFYSPYLLAEGESSQSETGTPENWIIEKVDCVGNYVTSCSIIQNDLYLNPGDKVNEEEIENARLRMKSSGLFYDAQISLQKGSQRGQVIVLVEVQERSGHYVNLSGSTSWLSKGGEPSTAGSINVGDRNLLGLGKRLDLGFSKLFESRNDNDRFQNFTATYEDPNLFGSSKYFGSFQYSQYHFSDLSYDDETENYDLSVGRRLFDFSYIKLSHKLSKYRSHQSYVDPYYWGYRPEVSEWKTTSETLEYGWNTKDDLFFPTSGSTLATGVTFPDSRTAIYYVSGSYTKQLSEDYFLNLDGSATYWPTSSLYQEIGLNYGAQLARYFTFQRQGNKIPDKMKIFAGVDSGKPFAETASYVSYKAGVSYLIDSFGELSFNLAYQGAP